MILANGIQLANCKKLNCEFNNNDHSYVVTLYSCSVSSLENHYDNIIIDGYTGYHLPFKNDWDVNEMNIYDTNTKYIPANIGIFFKITFFQMIKSQLMEIRSKDFNQMQKLELLSLLNNKLTFLPLDVFSTLTNLRILELGNNHIEEIQNGVFDNNLNLEEIYMANNQIKYIGPNSLNRLAKLNDGYFVDNIYVDKKYQGSKEINQLKKDIKTNCYLLKPTKVPLTTTTTTTENPMKNERIQMQVKVINLEKELSDLKKELRKAREGEQQFQRDLNETHTEKDVLEEKLIKRTVEINELKQDFEIKCKNKNEAIDVKLDEISTNIILNKEDNRKEFNEIKTELIVTKDVHQQTKLENQKELQDLNEMMKQLLKSSNKQQMERYENMKLKTELAKAKDQLQEEQKGHIEVVTEKDAMKIELVETKFIIDVKVPKLELEVNELSEGIFKLKEQLHREKATCNEMRTKLIKANEKLADCTLATVDDRLLVL